MKTLSLMSDAFQSGAPIPKKYTGEGQDISPQLSWSGAPQETKSFVVICDDPDAPMGTWVHWVIFNLPAAVMALKEGVDIKALGGVVGKNSWPKNLYGGPMPPVGTGKHRYFFKVYALDNVLNLDARATKQDVEKAMRGHILAKQENFYGTYERTGK